MRLLAYWQLHKLARKHHDDDLPQMAIFSHDHIGHVINIDGRYEDDYLKTVFGWLCKEKPEMGQTIALDIGANIGNHAVFFAKYFRTVYAFEPNPRTFELLKFNASLADNVVVVAQGLSDSNVSGTLRENPTNMGGTSIDLHSQDKMPHSLSVSLKTLDSFVDSYALDNISLMKIDTEGFEARILKGARHVIETNKPVIIFELSPTDFDQQASSEVVTILENLGYEFLTLERNFNLGGTKLGRYLGFVLRTIFGDYYRLTKIKRFKPKFYQMVVATHNIAPLVR